jgi:outer membrane protein assembly factor BamB
VGETVMGGFASPAAANNRVFMAYWRPAGTALVKSLVDRDKAGREAIFALLIRADDVAAGYDARTGATLWKTVFPLKGANRGGMHKSGFQGSPCAAGDAVFVMGSQLKLYCLDAATGQPRWESDLGPGHHRIEREMAASLRLQVLLGGGSPGGGPEWTNRGLQSMPRLIGGVLVIHDGQRFNAGLVGVDPATGKRLWHTAMVTDWVPLLWRHGDREYVVGLGPLGAAALDPRDGRVLWRLEGVKAGYIGSNAVCGDILVAHGPEGRRTGYRMTPTACAKAWELPEALSHMGAPATAHRGRIYCFSKDTASLLAIDPADGTVAAKAAHAPGAIIEHGTLLVGAGNRMWSDNGRELQGLYYWALDRDAPRALGFLPFPRTAGYAIAVEPAVADGRMFLRLHDRLACYDLRAGTE